MALSTSFLFLVNIYLVKLGELEPSSVTLTRGLLQIGIFSIVLCKSEKNENDDNSAEICDKKDDELSYFRKRKPLFLTILYGFIAASLSFSFILGK